MAKTKEQKKKLIDLYKKILQGGPNYILVRTDSVSMTQLTELKKALQETQSTFHVIKNTLFKLAAEETGQPTRVQEVEDATGIVVCGEDITEPAKILKKMQKEYENLDTRFGILFGEVAESDKVNQLAEIPSREELLAKLVGSMSAPLSGFMSVTRGNLRQFIQALSEISKSK